MNSAYNYSGFVDLVATPGTGPSERPVPGSGAAATEPVCEDEPAPPREKLYPEVNEP